MKISTYLLAYWIIFIGYNSASAQESKYHIREFAPVYKTDSFYVSGNASLVKECVIKVLREKGVKSAYWDEDSNTLTVQFNSRQTNIINIKTFFSYRNILAATVNNKEKESGTMAN